MTDLIQIAPECPFCQANHPQSFTREDLAELLKYDTLKLYCPRTDRNWRANFEQRDTLSRMLAKGIPRLT